MKIIGITGGSGAGKSIVAGIWKDMGARVIDADAVYHRLLRVNRAMLGEIARRFPPAVRNGNVDRAALREIVFSDAGALRDLNVITHKYVIAEVIGELERAGGDGAGVAVVEALYLAENELAQACDLTVAVVAPADVRLRRITSRDGLTEGEARDRIRSQQPDEYYFSSCDSVIENTGSFADLKAKAEAIYKNITCDSEPL